MTIFEALKILLTASASSISSLSPSKEYHKAYEYLVNEEHNPKSLQFIKRIFPKWEHSQENRFNQSEISQLLQLFNGYFSDIANEKNIVIVVGEKWVGKSSVIAYLTGTQYELDQDEFGEDCLKVKSANDGSASSDSCRAGKDKEEHLLPYLHRRAGARSYLEVSEGSGDSNQRAFVYFLNGLTLERLHAPLACILVIDMIATHNTANDRRPRLLKLALEWRNLLQAVLSKPNPPQLSCVVTRLHRSRAVFNPVVIRSGVFTQVKKLMVEKQNELFDERASLPFQGSIDNWGTLVSEFKKQKSEMMKTKPRDAESRMDAIFRFQASINTDAFLLQMFGKEESIFIIRCFQDDPNDPHEQRDHRDSLISWFSKVESEQLKAPVSTPSLTHRAAAYTSPPFFAGSKLAPKVDSDEEDDSEYMLVQKPASPVGMQH